MCFQIAEAYTVNLRMVDYPVTQGFSGYISGRYYGYVAGVYNFSVQGTSGTFEGFCIEYQYASTAYHPYDLVGIIGANQIKAAWLFDQFRTGGLDSYSPNRNTLAAATQVAIWEFMTETGSQWEVRSTNTDKGVTWTSSAYAGFAQELVGLANTHGDFDASGYRLATNSTYQNYLVPVPLPPAAWLLGSGLIGLVVIRRRMKK
jgi:hypothetical protein